MTHPLDLPEVTDVIASFLSNKSLLQSVLVNHHFHRSFHPHLYNSLFLVASDYFHPRSLPSLVLHASSVRSLKLHQVDIHTPSRHFLLLTFPRLHTLELSLSYHTPTGTREILEPALDFIDRHARLRLDSIDFRGGPTEIPMIMVAVIIQSYCRDDEQETEKGDQKKQQHKQRCPGPRRLKNLALSSVSIDLETMDASFQNVFKNLNSLTMNAVHIKHPPAPARTNSDDPWDFLFEPPPLQQPPPHSIKKKAPPSSSVWKMENNNLRHLTTGSIRHLTRLGICGICDKEQYRLVLDSQHLRSLTWNYHWMKEPYQTLFAQDLHIRSGTNSGVLLWPFLNCLSFQNSQIPDEDLAEILLAMGTERPLRELDAQFTNFGPKSAEALLGGAYKVMDEDDETTGGNWRGREVHVATLTTLEGKSSLSYTHYLNHYQIGLPLERLLLIRSKATGSMIQQFLCSFPNLKEFNGSHMTDQDLRADPRPWVCSQKLRRLHLLIALENMPQEAQSEKVSGSAPEPGNSSSGISTQSLAIATVAATAAVSVAEPWQVKGVAAMEEAISPSGPVCGAGVPTDDQYNYQSAHLFLDRLSLLSGLRDLILSDFRPPSGFHPFRLGLDYDQERLEQLSRSMTLLTRVKWGGHDPKNQAHHVRMWDAHWMAATSWWANLNTIWIHDDIKIKEELKDWLQSRGVRCEDSRKADISG